MVHEKYVCEGSQGIDTARAAPVVIEKHGRPVVVVLSVEEYERLKAIKSKRARA